MTVQELFEQLKTLVEQGQGHRLVVMSRDPEGNSFSPLFQVERSRFDQSTDEVGLDELTPELMDEGYSEDDLLEDGTPSVTLWPE